MSSELTTTLDFQTRKLVSEAASHGKVEIKPFDLPIYIYGLLRRIITPEVNALSTVWIVMVFMVLLISQWLQSRNKEV